MNRSLASLSLLVAFGATGCLAGGPDDELLGSAQAAITQVPPMVSCIQIVAMGSKTVTDSFQVSPGQSSVVTMPALPVGAVTFTASAYNQNCNAVTAASVPSWLSDPTTVTLVAGKTANLTLNLRQNASASVGVNFQSDGGTVATPPDLSVPPGDGSVTPPHDGGLVAHDLATNHDGSIVVIHDLSTAHDLSHHGDGG